MNIKNELLQLMCKHNMTIKQVAQMINDSPNKLQKRFEEDKIKFSDAQKILNILGYNIIFTKIT